MKWSLQFLHYIFPWKPHQMNSTYSVCLFHMLMTKVTLKPRNSLICTLYFKATLTCEESIEHGPFYPQCDIDSNQFCWPLFRCFLTVNFITDFLYFSCNKYFIPFAKFCLTIPKSSNFCWTDLKDFWLAEKQHFLMQMIEIKALNLSFFSSHALRRQIMSPGSNWFSLK